MIDYLSIKGNTLWERWQYFAETRPNKDAIIHWVAGEEPYRWNYSNLFNTADKISAYIRKIGIKSGDVCAIIMRHNPFFHPLYLGISGAGALPAVLAYPNPRLHPNKFREGLLGMSQRSGLDWVLTERDLEEVLKPIIDNESSTVKDIHFPLDWDLGIEISEDEKKGLKLIRDSIKADDPLLLQHSSGTTGLQKPVVLSHKAILDHVINYGKSIDLSDDDIIVNWLPLYHDMGLIGAYHIPLASGITSIQIDPFEWVLAPILLFEAASKEKATITWLPNFSYNMMTDKLRSNELEELSLDSFRMIINGSEPVRSESHKMFYNRFKKYGLKKNTVSSFYAMAETTLTVTQTEPGKTPTEIAIARGELAHGKVALADKDMPERICVSSGKIIDGCSIKIVDEFREEVRDNGVGEIAVKSISMFDGYRNYPEKTSKVIDNEGWFYTGDIGFIYQEEVYVIGRKKDIIIVAGNNTYPEDIEDGINKVENIIPGRVIAFGEDDIELGTERIAVVAETKLEKENDFKTLRLNIIKAGMALDVNIQGVYLVPPRWLIKSSSGKPSRKANKNRILNKTDEKIWSIKW